MTISTKRVLITGGCGFIGTNLAAHYIDKGWEVTAYDNLSRLGAPLNAAWLHARGAGHQTEQPRKEVGCL